LRLGDCERADVGADERPEAAVGDADTPDLAGELLGVPKLSTGLGAVGADDGGGSVEVG
jgi:hypothetical protein